MNNFKKMLDQETLSEGAKDDYKALFVKTLKKYGGDLAKLSGKDEDDFWKEIDAKMSKK